MFVAALLDAFPALEPRVQESVRAAGLPERFRCHLVPHSDHALTGKLFLVREEGHPHAPGQAHVPDHAHGHHPFSLIRDRLAAAPLEPGILEQAIAIFGGLAEAEARVHGATPDTVTFHELGEWDSIADIVAAAAIVSALSSATWSVGPLPLGSGFVKSAHGLLPVPAPATALLLRGLAVRDDGIGGERVTPTGAAIARHLMSRTGEAPRVRRMQSTGIGFGTRALPGLSNCLRVLVFDEAAAPEEAPEKEGRVVSIEFEVDDQTPEDLAIGLDRLRAEASVLDVLQTPALGKKGRVVMAVRILCAAEAEPEVVRLCFLETTTLGLRVSEPRRHTLSRSRDTAVVLGHSIERKHADRGPHRTPKVEAESLRDVAGHHERERLRRAALEE